MTENYFDKLKDAICELVNLAEDATSREVFEMLDNAGADAIDCLDRLSGFEAIGTIEEFKALKEKSVAKKIVVKKNGDITFFLCPQCNKLAGNSIMRVESSHCSGCGQKLDWSE